MLHIYVSILTCKYIIGTQPPPTTKITLAAPPVFLFACVNIIHMVYIIMTIFGCSGHFSAPSTSSMTGLHRLATQPPPFFLCPFIAQFPSFLGRRTFARIQHIFRWKTDFEWARSNLFNKKRHTPPTIPLLFMDNLWKSLSLSPSLTPLTTTLGLLNSVKLTTEGI